MQQAEQLEERYFLSHDFFYTKFFLRPDLFATHSKYTQMPGVIKRGPTTPTNPSKYALNQMPKDCASVLTKKIYR
jgi:hypothetical protein